MSEQTVLVYDRDIYDDTDAERNSVENVVWNKYTYTAYVQWHSVINTIYSYNVTSTEWEELVDTVERVGSVGSALGRVQWGRSIANYDGYSTTLKSRRSEATLSATPATSGNQYEVMLSFTGTITVKVGAENLEGAVKNAASMFQNDATSGELEVLEVKKVN